MKNNIFKYVKYAFPLTIPILLGFLFLGMSYGVLMVTHDYPWYYPTMTSIVIFGGSLEFLCVNLLQAAFNPLQAFAIAFLVNARHLFYGLALLKRYRNLGFKKLYMMYALTDESFSVIYNTKKPDDLDDGWFMFTVSLLNQIYWVTGVTLGAILGQVLPIPTRGLEFVMTSMFVVILYEQIQATKNYYSAAVGVVATLVCLVIFGKNIFLLPSMALIILFLYIYTIYEKRHTP